MNRSFGTSSFPRACQYEAFLKSAELYFGGTVIGPLFPGILKPLQRQVSPTPPAPAAPNPYTGTPQEWHRLIGQQPHQRNA